MTKAVEMVLEWVAQTDASKAEYSAARWGNLMVVSMAATTVVTMDACWAGLKAALTDAMWAAKTDVPLAACLVPRLAVYSAARSAACSVASMDVMSVAQMDTCWAELTAASTAMTKAVMREHQ